jgi:hypothetical protein
MNTHTLHRTAPLRILALLLGLALVAGCGKAPAPAATNAFQTPEDAAAAFVARIEANDVAGLSTLLGVDAAELLDSGDAVQDAGDRKEFIDAYRARHALVDDGADRKVLVIGENEWPMPIPLVKAEGGWRFDGEAGLDELIFRRVGGNELGAIAVCRGFVDAQVEYASEGRDGDPPGIFALKLVSDPGLHNGLYWETAEGEPASPAGPFVAAAADEGYNFATVERSPYHGYFYRMLYAQGPNASGGALDYFKDGLLTEGFALIAWPADYGSSGVMTFICNQDGVVFQKDLGEDTAAAADAIEIYDPDSSWTAIVPDDLESPPAS